MKRCLAIALACLGPLLLVPAAWAGHFTIPRASQLSPGTLGATQLFPEALGAQTGDALDAAQRSLGKPGQDPAEGSFDVEQFEVLGHHDLAGTGFNADVYAFGRFAYVGSWVFRFGSVFTICPADGVRAVDISKPARPTLAGILQNPPGTSSEDVVVKHLETPHFQGNLLVTGIQPCSRFSNVFRGLQLFDVTDPYNARELGRWEAPPRTEGCHEVDLTVREDGRALAGCATPYAEVDSPGADAVTFVDVTNPHAPTRAGGWALRRDLGIQHERRVGCFPESFAHNPRFADGGRSVYVSYWDAGTMLFDIADPAAPRLVSKALVVPPDEDGNNHSVGLVRGGDVLLINPEDMSPLDRVFGLCPPGDWNGWGELYIFDNRDRANPRLITSFSTPNSDTNRNDPLTSGIFTVHNTEVVDGDQVFASWYSDGIRWIDLSDPAAPVERGHFVPPAGRDPHGILPPVPFVWGVAPDEKGKLILASDVHTGLWILKPKAVKSEGHKAGLKG